LLTCNFAAEWNEAQFDSGQSAFSVEYDIINNDYRLLHLDTNTFCSGGGFLKNGTFISTGGGERKGRTWKALEGWQSIRHFTPCQDGECQWSEWTTQQMIGNRWYPTVEQMPEVRNQNSDEGTLYLPCPVLIYLSIFHRAV
jgi:hypothetical protein